VAFPSGTVDAEAFGVAVERFHETHEREYTYRLPSLVELVNYHVVAFGLVPKPELAKLSATGRRPADAMRGKRTVDFDTHGVHTTAIYERNRLEPGMEIDGPAIVEEPATTIVVFPGQQTKVDDYGNLRIHAS
jgi:N-methylhydantoinase A